MWLYFCENWIFQHLDFSWVFVIHLIISDKPPYASAAPRCWRHNVDETHSWPLQKLWSLQGQQSTTCRSSTAHSEERFLNGRKRIKSSILWHVKMIWNSNFSTISSFAVIQPHSFVCALSTADFTWKGRVELVMIVPSSPKCLKYLWSSPLWKKCFKFST